VQVTIDENGNVISASAVSGHPLLRQAAEQAARQAVFKPTLLSDQPVKVTGVIVYNFVPTKSPANENAPLWAFGMTLSFLQTADSALINEIRNEKELNEILTEMASDAPTEWATEKPLFDKLAKSTGEERRQIAGELLGSIKNQITDKGKWQIEIGEHLGITMTELVKHIKKLNSNGEVNESVLRMSLQKIKDSLLAAPPETSPELVKNFKSVADFADAPELSSHIALSQLAEAIEPLFGSFSDE